VQHGNGPHGAGPAAGVHGSRRSRGDQRGHFDPAADGAKSRDRRRDLRVQSSVGQNEFVSFFGQLVSLVLPMLDVFNIQAAVAGGKQVPLDYLGWALLYCVIYSTVAMLFALILFEDRDLA
jgi:hypothetical protein